MASQAGPHAYFRKIGDPKVQTQLLSGGENGGELHDGQYDVNGLLSADTKVIKMRIAATVRSKIFIFNHLE